MLDICLFHELVSSVHRRAFSMISGPLPGCPLFVRRQERLDQQADLFLRLRQRRHHMRRATTTDAQFRLAQITLCIPQSHNEVYPWKSTTKLFA
jgi:hypothetical protein